MNKILQGVLVLDTETSRELKKGGKIDIEVGGNNVHVELDNNQELTFETKKISKNVVVECFSQDKLYLDKGHYDRLMQGETLEVKDGTLSKNDDGTFKLTARNSQTIQIVCYR